MFVRQIEWSDRGVWLKADLHLHTRFSDGALALEEVAERGVRHGCDVLAFTDHADAALRGASPEYFLSLEQARGRFPEAILLAGVEWNVLPWDGREHALVLAPADSNERQLLGDFKMLFDDLHENEAVANRTASRALGWLAEQAAAQHVESPVVIYNHPSRKRDDSLSLVDEFVRLRKSSEILVGFEGAPGHQQGPPIGAYEQRIQTIDRWDPAAAEAGNAWDELARKGIDVWAAVANSDYHESGGPKTIDYDPGEFAATWIYAPTRDARGVLAALRAGSFFGVHGLIAEHAVLSITVDGLPRPAIAGESICVAANTRLQCRLDCDVPPVDWRQQPNRIASVDFLITDEIGTEVRTVEVDAQDRVTAQIQLAVPPGGCSIRARGRRVITGGPDLLFYTNPVRILIESIIPVPAEPRPAAADLLNDQIDR
jgi:hypothetical protein